MGSGWGGVEREVTHHSACNRASASLCFSQDPPGAGASNAIPTGAQRGVGSQLEGLSGADSGVEQVFRTNKLTIESFGLSLWWSGLVDEKKQDKLRVVYYTTSSSRIVYAV